MIIIVDFGSQTTHLISRRILDFGVPTEIVDPKEAMKKIDALKPAGIILSGGPASVYEEGAPTIDAKVFELGVPILGICYGWQLTAQLLGGKVESAKKEYGPADFTTTDFSDLCYGFTEETRVFESHGDSVVRLPTGFVGIGSTPSLEEAAVKWVNPTHKIFGVQFHPEMHHTKEGKHLLQNFVTRICLLGMKTKKIDLEAMLAEIREKVGDKKVIGAFSGGTDSAVAGMLVAQAIGKNFIPFYVESGLMRLGTKERVQEEFPKLLGVPVRVIEAEEEFLSRLKGVTDPELKRKTIGNLYIELFERELERHPDVTFLLQGTTYADFIQAKGQGKERSAHIKSHHNVGGLPENMKLKLLEPLRYYYTDEVRKIGLKLGLPRDVVFQQPFPGPGHAVRILGEVTRERLAKQRMADGILVDEMKKSGWYTKIFQCWTVLTDCQSTAVKGDGRFYGDVIALRIVNSVDRMTADWSRLPHAVLARLSARIVNEVPDVSRVVYDITTKPPATMEWE